MKEYRQVRKGLFRVVSFRDLKPPADVNPERLCWQISISASGKKQLLFANKVAPFQQLYLFVRVNSTVCCTFEVKSSKQLRVHKGLNNILVSCNDSCASNTSWQPSGREKIENSTVLVFGQWNVKEYSAYSNLPFRIQVLQIKMSWHVLPEQNLSLQSDQSIVILSL